MKLTYKVHKRHFSLNPFWSSPDILEFTKEQYVLIALKNACSHITVYELAELFGIEEVEKIYLDLKKKNYFKTKKCRAYIEQGIFLTKEEKKILANDKKITFIKGVFMKKETKKVLDRIKSFPFFKEKRAVLIGGTALSIHLSHRLSEDLDFMFYLEEKLPKDELLSFSSKHNAKFLPFEQSIIDEFINEGGDIEDYQQKFLIDDIKVEFTASLGNILEKDIINSREIEVIDNIPVASLKTLKQMKCLLLMDRDKARDMYDVAYMLQNGILKPKEMLKIIARYRLTFDENYVLMRLSHKKPSENDEGLDGLMANPPSFEELKEYLVTQTKKGMIEIRKDFHKKRGVKSLSL